MGVQNLESLVQEIRRYMNPNLSIGGILLTKVQRTNVASQVEAQVREYFGSKVFKAHIPLNVKVEEAHSRGRSVLDYAPDSVGAQAYLSLTSEILDHE